MQAPDPPEKWQHDQDRTFDSIVNTKGSNPSPDEPCGIPVFYDEIVDDREQAQEGNNVPLLSARARLREKLQKYQIARQRGARPQSE